MPHPTLIEMTASTTDPKVIATLLRQVADQVDNLTPLHDRARNYVYRGTLREEGKDAVVFSAHMEPLRR